jgi:hypothetical protein
MSSSIGSLIVRLGLDAAEFTGGLTKAEYQARKFGEAIGTGIRSAATAAAASLATLGAGAVAAGVAVNSLIKSAGDFQDLAEKTGASAEALASFAVAAGTSGASMDSIASASIKLSTNLSGVNDESKAAGAALGALGLNIKAFKALDPATQLETVAKAMGTFADGSGKTAAAVALLGRSGAELLPFLKELGQEGGRQNILTAEQIRLADEYSDKQAKARAELMLHAQALATNFIPALTATQNAVKDLISQFIGANTAQKDFALNLVILDWAEKAALALTTVAETAVFLGKTMRAVGGSFESVFADSKLLGMLTPGGAAAALVRGDSIGSLLEERNKKADEANKRYVDLWNYDSTAATKAIRKSFQDQRNVIKNMADPEIQRLLARSRAGQDPQAGVPFKQPSKGGGKDDPTKKLLDNQLKELQRAAKAEEELLQSRNKVLDLFYGENLVSIEDYYAARIANQQEATTKEVALINEQIAALEKYKASAAKDVDRADAQGKINALLDEEAKLQRAAGEAAIEQSIRKNRAIQQYKDALGQAQAVLLDMQGNSGAAAQIRVEIQYRELLTRATAENDEAAKRLIGTLKEQTVAQAKFGTVATESSQVMARLQIDEDRIALARQLGSTGELESLVRLGTARRGAVAQLQSIVEAQEAIAKASGNPQLILNAEQARAALEKLAATADPLAEKFNTMFSDAFGDAFADFVTGTKTAKEAFDSFAKSVLSQIAKMAAQSLAKSLFGGGDGGGGGFFSTIFSAIFGGGKPIGGPVSAGTMYRVNERGPEMLDVNGKQFLMMGSKGGRVTPNSGGGGPVTVIQQFTVGDVASVSLVQKAVANSEKRISGAIARNQRMGGSMA